MQEFRIFVSYSREDAPLVTPLVKLLRLGGAGVFQDVDHIPLGAQWRAVLIQAVDTCEVLLLFWCVHSAESDEVKKEYEQAIQGNKVVVPVLLDETPLNSRLAEYQALDMQCIFRDHSERWVEEQHRVRGLLPGTTETRVVRKLQVLPPPLTALKEGARRIGDALTSAIVAQLTAE